MGVKIQFSIKGLLLGVSILSTIAIIGTFFISFVSFRESVVTQMASIAELNTSILQRLMLEPMQLSDYVEIQRIVQNIGTSREVSYIRVTNEFGTEVAKTGKISSIDKQKMMIGHIVDSHRDRVLGSVEIGFNLSNVQQHIAKQFGLMLGIIILTFCLLIGLFFLVIRNFSVYFIALGKDLPEIFLGKVPAEIGGSRFFKEIADISAQIRMAAENVIRVRYQEAKMQKEIAIGKLTQMIAHDVRALFAMTKAGLFSLRETRTFSQMQSRSTLLLREVDISIAKVEGLLEDILESGREAAPMQEPTSLESLVQAVVKEVFQMYMTARVDISYDFRHTKQLHIEASKVLRVLFNIANNAIQAMGKQGSLLFFSEDMENDENFAHIIVGNNGPLIPVEVIPVLFSSFFTSGKKGGTGLGLAIVEKVIAAHGGRIWCESPGTYSQVEFHFILPCSEMPKLQVFGDLFTSSECATAAYNESMKFNEEDNAFAHTKDASSIELEVKIASHLKERGSPFRILLLEDESFYRTKLCELIERNALFGDHIVFEQEEDPDRAIVFVKKAHPDLVILDVDLGSNKNGFDVAQEITMQGYQGKICIHSNRGSKEDLATASRVGADSYCPKPMARIYLLKLIAICLNIDLSLPSSFEETAENADNKESQDCSRIISNNVNNVEELEQLPLVILIEDAAFMRFLCAEKMKDARLVMFTHPEAFLEAMRAVPGTMGTESDLIKTAKAILLDNQFDELSSRTGLEFGRELRKQYDIHISIFLFSNGIYTEDETMGVFDGCLPKEPLTYAKLQETFPFLEN